MSHSQGMTLIQDLKTVMDKVFIKQLKSNLLLRRQKHASRDSSTY